MCSLIPLVAKLPMPQLGLSTPVAIAYTGALTISLIVHHAVAEGQYSSILTLSAIIQCLGLCFLCMQVLSSGSAAGISASALMLDIAAISLRLSSTLFHDGYIPVDASGDFLFQAVDVCSLVLLFGLLHQVLVVKRYSYQQEEDSVNIAPMVLVSLVLAVFLHPNMNDKPLFDILWMTGLFVSTVSVMPQLWLIMKSGGRADALSCHYIAALGFSKVLSGLFMWEARLDINCNEWIVKGFSHGIIAILCAHLLHLLLIVDFMLFYVRSLMQNGPQMLISMKPESSDGWI